MPRFQSWSWSDNLLVLGFSISFAVLRCLLNTLAKAHQQLDKTVDLCYRPHPFINETKRIEFLFELYDRYTAGLFSKEKKGRKKAK